MGSALSTLGLGDNNNGDKGIFNSGYNNELHCCDGVVDPLTLLTVLGAIVGLTFYLRQLIIDNVVGRKRRHVLNSDTISLSFIFRKGEHETKVEIKFGIKCFSDRYLVIAFLVYIPFGYAKISY